MISVAAFDPPNAAPTMTITEEETGKADVTASRMAPLSEDAELKIHIQNLVMPGGSFHPKDRLSLSSTSGTAHHGMDSGYGSLTDSASRTLNRDDHERGTGEGNISEPQNGSCKTSLTDGYGSTIDPSSLKRPRTNTLESLFTKPRQLKSYPELEVPEEVHSRFCDLKDLFEKPFFQALWKGCASSTALVWRLMMLGEDKSTARPWAVVFCDRSVAKKARKFFKQSWVKRYCHDEDHPQIDFLVYERPPRLNFSDSTVFKQQDAVTPGTSCGILVRNSMGQAFTLGGVIIVDTGSHAGIYGLTCGHHILPNDVSKGYNDASLDPKITSEVSGFSLRPGLEAGWANDKKYDDDKDNDEDDDEDDDKQQDEDGIELVLDLHDIEERVHPHVSIKPVDQGSEIANRNALEIGRIYASSYDEVNEGPNFDWALVEFRTPAQCLPNPAPFWAVPFRLQARSYRPPLRQKSLTPVTLYSGLSNLRKCVLSHQNSFFIHPHSRSFVKVMMLHINSGLGQCSLRLQNAF